ncbi:MAG: intradiol ring-cleavage dioxygenase [Sphingomonadaceae bacterium]|nr:intradiol ring-cleavage dioxygenase [Sphingomonadaceae bacterium]
MTPRQTEGPFYFDPRLTRADIAEDRSGVPLRLRLQVVEAKGCAPATGARVDIWHCDADGVYSGYAREGAADAAWLRGTQLADAEGIVAFETIYPGWYSGRAVHIHCKAWLTDGREITSQLYFPDELTDQIHARPPYAQRGQRRRRNDDDGIFRRAGGAAMLDMRGNPDGHLGSVVIALS